MRYAVLGGVSASAFYLGCQTPAEVATDKDVDSFLAVPVAERLADSISRGEFRYIARHGYVTYAPCSPDETWKTDRDFYDPEKVIWPPGEPTKLDAADFAELMKRLERYACEYNSGIAEALQEKSTRPHNQPMQTDEP